MILKSENTNNLISINTLSLTDYLLKINKHLGATVYQNVVNAVGSNIEVKKEFSLEEMHIYGSSRHGIHKPSVTLVNKTYKLNNIDSATDSSMAVLNYKYFKRTLTYKQYELTNHLGNVLATVLDRKTFVGDDTLEYYAADVYTAGLYYAFGGGIEEMQYKSDTSNFYRYAFNGEELMNELAGEGMAYDLGERFYDPRLGRMFSLDPLMAQYPWQSPYAYCYNNPIWIVDVKGMGGGTDEPVTHTTQKDETLWGVSKDYYNKNKDAIGMSWGNYWNLVLKWNNGGNYGKIGGTMYLSDPSKKSNENKRNEDIEKFKKYPEVERNPRRPDLWKASRVDSDGNYFDNVTTWDGLYHASTVGTEVCNVKGELLNILKNDIQDFYGPTGSSVYSPMIEKYKNAKKTQGTSYYFGENYVRFGPTSKIGAATSAFTSTITMRNAYCYFWVEDYNDNYYIIYMHVYDYFDLAPDWEHKDPYYNYIAEPLHRVHLALGYNPNMQVRAQWSILIKK